MKKLFIASAALVASAGSALANDPAFCASFPTAPACATPIPEISAMEGTAAVAVVVAIVLLAWERRRRAV